MIYGSRGPTWEDTPPRPAFLYLVHFSKNRSNEHEAEL